MRGTRSHGGQQCSGDGAGRALGVVQIFAVRRILVEGNPREDSLEPSFNLSVFMETTHIRLLNSTQVSLVRGCLLSTF